MRGFRCRSYVLAAAVLRACWIALLGASLTAAEAIGPGAWPRVSTSNPQLSHSVKQALDGASRKLGDMGCRRVFSDFQDRSGRPLADRLLELSPNGESYLELLLFRDGANKLMCQREGVMAFTGPGARVVFVCGGKFERLWKQDPGFAEAAIIHEVLHTLGLGENPPTSQAITEHVIKRCGR